MMLDRITMYRVVMYGLLVIAFASLTLSVAGILSVPPLTLLGSFLVIVASAFLTHFICVSITKAPSNVESSFITALILFLILSPATTLIEIALLAAITAAAIVLKYIVRFHYRHVFNPVALVLVLLSFTSYVGAAWWVGSRYLWPVVLVAGIAVVSKTRRWPLVLTYVGFSALLAIIVYGGEESVTEVLLTHFTSWPTLFFAAFMLTEPLGLPSTRNLQYAYALIAASVATLPFVLGPLGASPALALVTANLFTFLVDHPERLRLSLVRKEMVGAGTVEYIFKAPRIERFIPGQYLEWTLPHHHADVRGIRRYFTIAAAPGTDEVSFAVRHMEQQSTWKKTLSTLAPGALLYATQRAGDFTLRNNAVHHVWIAGGIGITPFMSMIRHAERTKTTLSATLFYCNKTEHDIAFLTEIARAAAVGVTVVHVLAEPATSGMPHAVGFVTEALITQHVPNAQTATYYISGPPGLVGAYTTMLAKMKIPRRRVVTDYFPGLA